MKEAVRVGVIGCGDVGNVYHWPNWDRLPTVRVTAITDPRKDAAESAARRFGARTYTSHRTLIEKADVDALFIFLPPFAHGEPEMLAAERGLPFFVEKPVALSLETARAVADAVSDRSLITSVGYQWRYDSSVQVAKAILGERKIALIHGYWLGSAAHRTTPLWWRDRSLSGGQLIEQSTHMIDLLRYFGGEVSTVYCHQVRRLADETIPDAGAVVFHFANGAVGSLVNGCSLPRNTFRAGLTVVASGVLLEVTRGKVAIQLGGDQTEYCSPKELHHDPYFLEDQTFIEAVLTGDASKIRSTYSDATQTLAISLAAEESSRTGQTVRVDQPFPREP